MKAFSLSSYLNNKSVLEAFEHQTDTSASLQKCVTVRFSSRTVVEGLQS